MAKKPESSRDGDKFNKDKGLEKHSKDDISKQATGVADDKKNNRKFKKPFRKGTNDPNWYVANATIVKDVANLPFAVYNGLQYNNTESVSSKMFPSGHANMQTQTPGVAAYKYIPWYGTSTPTSALNLTMRALYSYVRHVNSGKTNYEAPDLMLYIMAMDSVYLIIHEIKRFVRLAYLYVLENRNIPEKIYSLLNMDISDVVGNLANYRAQLNVRIAKANSLAVPANFNLFKRRSVMGSVVLSDEPNRPTELIIPKADGYYKYDATSQASGGSLKYVMPGKLRANDTQAKLQKQSGTCVLTASKHTLNDYFRLLDDMLSVLLSDEDINIMSGDIIKAYGDNLFKLPFLEPNEIQDIIHDENLLLQFTNSTVLDIPGASFAYNSSDGNKGFSGTVNLIEWKQPANNNLYTDTPIIGQVNGSLVAECSVNANQTLVGHPGTRANQLALLVQKELFIETSSANSISPENILEWTRLSMLFNKHQSYVDRYILEAGVEIGLGWVVAFPDVNVTPLGVLSTNHTIDRTYINQWFQFGHRNTLDSRVQLPSPTDLDATTNKSVLYIIEEGINTGMTNNTWARKWNTTYSSKFMEGLNFGPRAYELGAVNILQDASVVYGDMSIGKMYEKTAVASRNNITSMHDAALLGLISSPYVTTSK